MVSIILAAIALLWHLITGWRIFLAIAGRLIVRVAEIEAAPQVLAFAGAFVAKSIEVMRIAAFLAFLEAEAILAANITACICLTYHILSAAAWTVLVNCARLTALIADSIAVERLSALIAFLFDDALQAAIFLAFIKGTVRLGMHAAFIALTYFFADRMHAIMLAVLAPALFCFIKNLS
jgi:hypothetical protein